MRKYWIALNFHKFFHEEGYYISLLPFFSCILILIQLAKTSYDFLPSAVSLNKHPVNVLSESSASYWGAVFNWFIVHMAGNATGRISSHQKLLLVEHLRSEASNWIDRVLMDVQRKSPSYLNIHRSVACREIQSKPVHNNSSSEFLLSASHYSRYSLGATMPPAFLLSAPLSST